MKPPDNGVARYVRWALLCERQLALCVKHNAEFQDVERAKEKFSQLNRSNRAVTSDLGKWNDEDLTLIQEIDEIREVMLFAQRRQEVEEAGEIFLPAIQDLQSKEFRTNVDTRLIWPNSADFITAAQELLVKFLHPDSSILSPSKPLLYYVGIPQQIGLYSFSYREKPSSNKIMLDPMFMDRFFQPSKVDRGSLSRHFASADPTVRSSIKNLRGCAMMSEVYHLLPGAEISTLVLKGNLHTAKWNAECKEDAGLTRSQAFACIAMFDSGTSNIDPGSLSEVFALSSGNSLFIAAVLLCDPFEKPGTTEIRRVVGNVGRAGMTFLIAPPKVKTREANPEHWMSINHTRFDGQPESYFKNTSIHLSFTDYEIPLVTDENNQHFIDRVVVLVETLISVYDGQTWVGEVDILKTFKNLKTFRKNMNEGNDHGCSTKEKSKSYQEIVLGSPQLVATSIENWDELIEAPSSGTIVIKAHKNWLARLAVTAMCVKYGFSPIVLPEEVRFDMVAEGLNGLFLFIHSSILLLSLVQKRRNEAYFTLPTMRPESQLEALSSLLKYSISDSY